MCTSEGDKYLSFYEWCKLGEYGQSTNKCLRKQGWRRFLRGSISLFSQVILDASFPLTTVVPRIMIPHPHPRARSSELGPESSCGAWIIASLLLFLGFGESYKRCDPTFGWRVGLCIGRRTFYNVRSSSLSDGQWDTELILTCKAGSSK